MARVFIGIGSNQGERLLHISEAVKRLGELPKTNLVRVAAIYETEPVGNTDQGDFLNTVSEVQTSLNPHELLAHLKKIEIFMGRILSDSKWGPRVIDLDILFYDEQAINSDGLVIPHPQIEFRRFVLGPLAELDCDLRHPIIGLSIAELLRRLGNDVQRVKKIA